MEATMSEGGVLRWVDPALLHLTLRFLGEVEEASLGALQERLHEIAPFDLAIAGAAPGTFGPPRRTQVVWIGLGGEVTWPRPTYPGDTLRVETEVLAIRVSESKPDRGIVTVRNRTLNQQGEPVQIAVVKMLVPRRPGA